VIPEAWPPLLLAEQQEEVAVVSAVEVLAGKPEEPERRQPE